MTEIEKQEILRSFSAVIDYLTKQHEAEETNAIQSALLYNLTSSSVDGLSIPAMPFPFAAPSSIAGQETQLTHLTQTADYISKTEASALTDESIRRFVQSLQ
jgi:hypothetical protein